MTVGARAVSSAEPDGPPPRRLPTSRPASRPASRPVVRPATLPPLPSREPDPPEHSIAPRKPRTLGGAVFLLVLAATLAGVVVVVVADWQTGLTLMGGAMLCAAGARAVLPNGQAGMLHVRRKLVDVSTLLLLGAGLVTLAAVIPPRPPL